MFAALAGVAVLYLAYCWRRRLDLPAGEVVYQDLGGKGYQVDTLVSRRLRLAGKPDMLIETPEGVVPLELKSTAIAPRGTQPYENHGAQLLAYCVLVEEVFHKRVTYGIVRYARHVDKIVRFKDEERNWLAEIIAQIHTARMHGSEFHRSHQHPGRCSGCGLSSQCGEALSRRKGR